MKQILLLLAIIVTSIPLKAEQLLPFTSDLNRVNTDYRPILKDTWEGIKARNVDPYIVKAIHRPKSEKPGDFVSEGIGYGMILALYSNDQDYFNKIWDAGEKYMWSSGGYNWRCSENGNVIGSGPATDAEEDIACMLIFADKLVEARIWTAHKSPNNVTYKERAQTLVTNFRQFIDNGDKILDPWPGAGNMTNIGYFAPAFYRIFSKFENYSDATYWNDVIDKNYAVLEKNPGYSKGLVADWLDNDGNFLPNGPGYNAYADGKYMYKDAIRIYWRVAIDYLWNKEPRAKKFLDNAMKFLRSKGGVKAANFYQMDGNLVPATDVWEDMNAGETYRSRREHSALTLGMWAPVALISGTDEEREEMSNELLKYYEGKSYWGKASSTEDYGTDIVGPDGMKFYEDTLHNEMYFDQFLGWFGAATISGNFVNVVNELNNPLWNKTVTFTKDLVATKDVAGSDLNITLNAEISKNSYYIVTVHNKDEDKELTYNLYTSGIIDTTITVNLDELYDIKRENSNVDVTIKIEDGDSQTENLELTKVEDYFASKYSMHIGPDPISTELNISYSLKKSGKVFFRMYSITGVEVKVFGQDAKKGKNFLSVNMSNVEKGIYKLIIEVDGEKFDTVTLYKI